VHLVIDSRVEHIYRRAKERYLGRVAIALIEGLHPLARIALTARVARRGQQFFNVQDEAAAVSFERVVRPAEKAASGDVMTMDEALAADDRVLLHMARMAVAEGNDPAKLAAEVARVAAKCLGCPEVAYGEMFWLAEMRVADAAGRARRSTGQESAKRILVLPSEATGLDLNQLLLFAEGSGDPWEDPRLDSGFFPTARPWDRILEDAGVLREAADRNYQLRWQRIHEAVRRAGGCFYPPDLFGPL
jgi:hypothetical protein